MLNPDRSCRAAVKRIAAWLSSQGKKLANDEDDPYIKARRRLPKTVPIRLLKHIGRRCHERASPGWQKSTRHRRAILGFAQQEPRPACHGRGFGAALVYSIDGGLLVRSNKLRIRPTTAQPPRMAASPTNAANIRSYPNSRCGIRGVDQFSAPCSGTRLRRWPLPCHSHGRRQGLKILWAETPVWVRLPPPVLVWVDSWGHRISARIAERASSFRRRESIPSPRGRETLRQRGCMSERDDGLRHYGETVAPPLVSLNGSIFTVPSGNLATTSSSPPNAFTIRRNVDICMSDCLSSFDKLGCLMPRASAT
jgi:hypothetical protein